MLTKRIISAIIGIILFFSFTVWGPFPFFIMIALLSCLGLYEYTRLMSAVIDVDYMAILGFGLIIIMFAYLNNRGIFSLPQGFSNILVLLLLIIKHLKQEEYDELIHQIALKYLGLIYISNGFVFFLLLRDYRSGVFSVTAALWLALLATWATDSGAYFVGKYLGRHKLAPRLSPNKTVEGALGGIVLSIVVVAFLSRVLGIFSPVWLIYAGVLAVFAITGDLFESAIKRQVGVKDSGVFLPGHGGVLDRFDSLLFSVPFTYYFLIFYLG